VAFWDSLAGKALGWRFRLVAIAVVGVEIKVIIAIVLTRSGWSQGDHRDRFGGEIGVAAIATARLTTANGLRS